MKTSHQVAGSSTALGICSPVTAIISGWCSSEYDIEKKRNPLKMELQNHERKKVLTKVQAPGTCIHTLALSIC